MHGVAHAARTEGTRPTLPDMYSMPLLLIACVGAPVRPSAVGEQGATHAVHTCEYGPTAEGALSDATTSFRVPALACRRAELGQPAHDAAGGAPAAAITAVLRGR